MPDSSVVEIAQAALSKAKNEFYDAVIFDTAGRLHIDENLMDELVDLKKRLNQKKFY